jgi:serine/threonine protein kinase
MCQETNQQKETRRIQEEVSIWARVGRHPHCVELYEVYADYKLTYMVMERCEAALVHRLTHMQYMGECEIARVFLEMALAVQHLHSLRIVHRDVKSDNFLFATGGTVKLCDFGFAALMPWTGRLLYGCYGTAPYMSPEMVRNEGHSLSTDVWSLGATAYVLLYGDFPYQPAVLNSSEMKVAVSTGFPLPRYQRRNLEVGDPSAAATDFVRSLLARRASNRPSATEALTHPFLQPKPSTPAATNREPSLVPVIHRARMTTRQFEAQAAKCTVDRSLDELLQRLQRQGFWRGGQGSRSFSDSNLVDEAQEASGDDECHDQPKQLFRKRSHESWGSISTDYTVHSSQTMPSFSTRNLEDLFDA